MAIEKEINLNVNSNIEGSIGQLKALKRELKGVDVGTEEFKKLYNQIDDLEDKIKSAKNKSSDWIDSLAAAGGPVGLLGESLNKLKVSTQSFGGALKATGIGLVVGLVASLAAAFNDNEKAQKKLQPLLNGLEKIFNGIFAVVEPLFNTLVDLAISALPMVSNAFGVVYASVSAVFQSLGALGSAIGKLIKGDFSGAWKDAKSSVNDFSKNYDETIKRFNSGTKEMTKTEIEEANKRAEEKRKAKEKQDALDKKSKKDSELTEEEKLKAFNELTKKYKKKLLDDNIEIDLTEIKNLDTKNQAQRDLIKNNNQQILDEYQQWQLHIDQITYDSEEAQKQRRQQAFLQKIEDFQNVANAVGSIAKSGEDVLASIQDIGIAKGKSGQTAMKALALVQIGVDSAVAFSKMMAGTEASAAGAASLAGPAAPATYLATKIAFYASGSATILSNIAKAKRLLSSGGDAGGGGGSAPAMSAPAAPSFNVVGNSGVNQVANVLNNQGMPPIKTYVTAGEVTTQQGLNRNIVSNATLG